jgi:hypothetical protein
VLLGLQTLVERCYGKGAYEGTLNYAAEPDPPLLGAEKDWAGKWLYDKGLRPRKSGRGAKANRGRADRVAGGE